MFCDFSVFCFHFVSKFVRRRTNASKKGKKKKQTFIVFEVKQQTGSETGSDATVFLPDHNFGRAFFILLLFVSDRGIKNPRAN